MSRNATNISQIGTVAVPVTDQERSLAFYVDVLGFEKTRDVPFGPGQRWIEVTPPAGGTTIAIPPLGDATAGIDTGIRLTTSDAEADHQTLRSMAVDVDTEYVLLLGVPLMFSLSV